MTPAPESRGKKILFSITLVCLTGLLSAQSGGLSTFTFLQLSAPARIAALGGNAIATRSDDISLSSQNPALLTPSMNGQISFSHCGLPAGIRHGYFTGGFSRKKIGTWSVGMQYINYGTFKQTSESGEEIGNINAGEYAFQLGWSKSLDSSLFIGAAAKYILSDMAGNTSNGIAADIGLNWYHQKSGWSVSLVLMNAGRQLKTYEGNQREKLPFEVQAGVSKKLDKAPFRFSFILQDLQNWNLKYKDPLVSETDPLTGESVSEKTSGMALFMRHAIINTEVLLSKNFHLRFGYNFLKRNETGFNSKMGLSGISMGLGFRINRFQLSYAHSVNNTTGGNNHFSISTSVQSFKSKK